MLCLKIFLRKRDTAHSILAIALLVAILASVNSIANFLNVQIKALAYQTSPFGKYIVVGGGSISDSVLDAQLVDCLIPLQYFESIVAERVFWSNVTFGRICAEMLVRGVDNVEKFLRSRGAYINGSVAKSVNEAVVGELAARVLSVGIDEKARIAYGARSIDVRVAGIFRTRTELDSEIILMIEAALNLTGGDHISLIEFTLKRGVNVGEALTEVSELLPENAKIIQVQQPALFAQQINIQMLDFLGVWSLVVYAVVASASYVIAAKLIEESSYEFLMLRALGARRTRLFRLIIFYVLIVAALGSMLGVALGVSGAQVASTVLSWLTPSVRITPLLDLSQSVWIFSAAILSAVIGCLYPAYRVADKIRYTEKLL